MATRAPPQENNPPFADAWCKSDHRVVKCAYTWTIKNFRFRPEATGQSIESSYFEDLQSKHKWCLQLYPRGADADSKEYISLYLLRVSAGVPNDRVKFRFSIVDAAREERAVREAPAVYKFYQGKDWGFRRYVTRELLLDEANGMLDRNNLTISCEVSALVDIVEESGQNIKTKIKVPKPTLSEDLGRLMYNEKFSDVTLCAAGREIQAHKAILAARSPVFAAILDSENEDHKRIEIPDMEYAILQEMLSFIYTGKTPKLKQMAMNLLAAAHKFQLKKLKTMCEEVLYKRLSVETASEILVLSETNSASELKAHTINFIANNRAVEVMNTPGWHSMLDSHPQLLAEVFRAVAARNNA